MTIVLMMTRIQLHKVLSWMYLSTKEKAIEMVEKITKTVNELIWPMGDAEKPKKDTNDVRTHSFEEKFTSFFLLTVIVLLIVVVTRALSVDSYLSF